MHPHIRTLALVFMVAATGTVAAADTGTLWHVTTSISGPGMSPPARVTDVCVTGGKQDQPPPAGQSDCQYTELSRSGTTVRYAVQCSTMKGTGEISYTPDHYSGKFDMQAAQGAVSATYEGRKLGTCTGAGANSGTQLGNGARRDGVDGQTDQGTRAPGAFGAVGSEVKSGISTGAGEVKDAATDVATDAAQSVKDNATQSVKDRAESVLHGLFGR